MLSGCFLLFHSFVVVVVVDDAVGVVAAAAGAVGVVVCIVGTCDAMFASCGDRSFACNCDALTL